MSDDYEDDSLSESEALLDEGPRDVDLSNAIANWWLFMEYNQSLWPKDKKEMLHLLQSFSQVQHQFSADQIKLFLISTKILQFDMQDQTMHFNKGELYYILKQIMVIFLIADVASNRFTRRKPHKLRHCQCKRGCGQIRATNAISES